MMVTRPESNSSVGQRLGEAEDQRGDQAAQHVADAAHDDDDQRLHGKAAPTVGFMGQKEDSRMPAMAASAPPVANASAL